MTTRLVFKPIDTSIAQRELEELQRKGDCQALYDRCFHEDLNVPMFARVMECLSHGWFTPTAYRDLWHKIDPLLKAYKKSSSHFMFNSSFLPGNGQALNSCTSSDGNTFAYISYTAVGIQEVGGRGPLTEQKLKDALAQGPDKELPCFVNVIKFHPMDARSFPIEIEGKDRGPRIPEVIGGDDRFIYLQVSGDGRTRTLIRRALKDESGEQSRGFNYPYPGSCYYLDCQTSRFWYIDPESTSLVESSVDGEQLNRCPIHLPTDLNIEQLDRLVMTSDGRTALVTINNRSDETRYLFGIIRLWPGNTNLRWFRRKDFDGVQSIVACDRLWGHSPADGQDSKDAFVIHDAAGQLYELDLTALEETGCSLEDVAGTKLLSPYRPMESAVKHNFSILALGRTHPVLASYDMSRNSIHIWDTTRKLLLFEIPCPYHIEAMYFMDKDRVLITISRSMLQTHGLVAVSFLDYACLVGKAPVLFDVVDYLRLKPLLSIAPSDPELLFLECLVKYFAQSKRSERDESKKLSSEVVS